MSTDILSLILNEAKSINVNDIAVPGESRPGHAQKVGFVNGEFAKRLYTITLRYAREAHSIIDEFGQDELSRQQQQQLWIQIGRSSELSSIANQLYWYEVYDELYLFGMVPEGHSACTFQNFEICIVRDKLMEMESSDYVEPNVFARPTGRLQ
jgi:hypothetical protein